MREDKYVPKICGSLIKPVILIDQIEVVVFYNIFSLVIFCYCHSNIFSSQVMFQVPTILAVT